LFIFSFPCCELAIVSFVACVSDVRNFLVGSLLAGWRERERGLPPFEEILVLRGLLWIT
jgi:hypothetical protein